MIRLLSLHLDRNLLLREVLAHVTLLEQATSTRELVSLITFLGRGQCLITRTALLVQRLSTEIHPLLGVALLADGPGIIRGQRLVADVDLLSLLQLLRLDV